MKLPFPRLIICFCILVISFAMMPILSGCVTNDDEGMESLDAATVAGMLPGNTGFMVYVDAQQFRNDDEMGEIYDGWSCLYKIFQRLYTYNTWSGIPFSEVNWGAYATIMGDNSSERRDLVIGGRFDLDTVRRELADDGWEQGEYKGYEVWRYYDVLSIAITDDYYISGVNTDCIDVISDNRSSQYDNPLVTEVFSRLSPGCFVGLAVHGSSPQKLNDWGQLIEGVSLSKNGERTMSAHGVFIFQDNDDALNALGEIEDAVADGWGWPLDIGEINVTIDGNIVEVRCEVDLEDIKGLAYRPEMQAQCK